MSHLADLERHLASWRCHLDDPLMAELATAIITKLEAEIATGRQRQEDQGECPMAKS